MSRRHIAVVVVVLVAIAVMLRSPAPSRRDRPKPKPTMSSTVASRLPRPEPRDMNFVGSKACQDCHEEIYEQYLNSSMGQSMANLAHAEPVENYAADPIDPPGNRLYTVSRDESGAVTQSEIMVDADGEEIYEQIKAIHYVIGSGERGRAYVTEEDGSLFQAPIGWYAQSGWDLSPGYEAENHPRFSRPVGDGCLYCHAGRVNSHKNTVDQYQQPVFLETAIGCERCHGPGGSHVQFHSSDDTQPDNIVNPIKLDASRRDSVCNQCHLLSQSVVPRSGRGFFDFRPGDALEDMFVILTQDDGTDEPQAFKAVSQVEQMQDSKCFQESQGELSCVSCHDPHSTPSSQQRIEHFRNRCLSCHQDKGCALDEESRARAPALNSCIHCHMPMTQTTNVPHTSLTNHGIVRHAPKPAVDRPAPERGAPSLRVFGDAEARLPAAEVDRAQAITLTNVAWTMQSPMIAQQALSHFQRVLEPMSSTLRVDLAWLEDVSFIGELGACYYLLQQLDSAAVCWQRVLELDPHNQTALLGMASVSRDRQEMEAYRSFLDQLSESAPRSEDLYQMQIRLEYYGGDQDKALESAERLLELNPTLIEPRKWLVTAYRARGDNTKADQHEALVQRMEIPPTDRGQP